MRMWFLFSRCPTPTEIGELSLRTPRLVAIYLCESEATATRFYLCESEATATRYYLRKRSDSNKVLSVRKRSDSNKVLSVRKRSDSNKVLSVRKRSDSNNNNNTRISDQHHVGPKPPDAITPRRN